MNQLKEKGIACSVYVGVSVPMCDLTLVNLSELGTYCLSWPLQCHQQCLLHLKSVKPLNVYAYSYLYLYEIVDFIWMKQ